MFAISNMLAGSLMSSVLVLWNSAAPFTLRVGPRRATQSGILEMADEYQELCVYGRAKLHRLSAVTAPRGP
jgi:hypothetical protein